MEEAYNDYRERNIQLKQRISDQLVQSGEKDRLKQLLHDKLIESGWKDEMKAYCKAIIRTKGVDQVTVEDLVEEITPKGRAAIPDDIKNELLDQITAFVEKAIDEKDTIKSI